MMRQATVRRRWRWVSILLLAIPLLIGTGCALTFTERIPPLKGEIVGDKSAGPARVLLALDSEFTNYKHTMYLGDHYAYELGEIFSSGAEDVVRALFTEVVVGKSGSPPTNIDLIVIPRVAAVRMSPLDTSLGLPRQRVATVSIEWTIREAAGKLVWLDTVEGEGSTSGGTAFSKNRLAIERLRLASGSAFRNAIIRIREAPEVLQWLRRVPEGRKPGGRRELGVLLGREGGSAENERFVNRAFMRPMLSPRQLAKFTRRHR